MRLPFLLGRPGGRNDEPGDRRCAASQKASSKAQWRSPGRTRVGTGDSGHFNAEQHGEHGAHGNTEQLTRPGAHLHGNPAICVIASIAGYHMDDIIADLYRRTMLSGAVSI